MTFKELCVKFIYYKKDDKYIYYIYEIIIKTVSFDPNRVLPPRICPRHTHIRKSWKHIHVHFFDSFYLKFQFNKIC